MPKCTINGKEVEVPQGATIIEAMRRVRPEDQQEIAHYCWHPGLSVAGVCRLCMVEIEGNPRLQIACNTQVTEGMKINNTSEKVKESVKWGLDFHLINHPLDCPICDQAGECGLQDQYMQYGKYDPEMAERKVKKHKVVSLGERVVLDSERCILCSRCVRFTNEVTKTDELGIFNRGDRAEIGTFDGKPLNNNYSLNTVDICPVGALTSKDFRFRQRVWLLKDFNSICTGCSTGCNTKVYFNKEGVFRMKPVENQDINGFWMCDKGRDVYKFVNKDSRLLDAKVVRAGKTEWTLPVSAARKIGDELRTSGGGSSTALVVTGQYSNEEYDSLFTWFKSVGGSQVFHWINNPGTFDSFDGLLLRGDLNPNTKGLLETLAKHGLKASELRGLAAAVSGGQAKTVIVAGPENQAFFPELSDVVRDVSKAAKLVWLQAGKNQALDALVGGDITLIPLKTYVEKDGTYVNYKGISQSVKKGVTIVPNALSIDEIVEAFSGDVVQIDLAANMVGAGRVHNEFTTLRGKL